MRKWLLVGILALAFVLRVVGLSNFPAGFTPDEASFGYDAYSLLKTGKDQWGETWPLTLRSFGDSKLPLYTYLTIPSVAVFGLNEFSTRLPNAIIGVLAVLATYLLTKKLFEREDLAHLSSLLLGVSPWHVTLSRGAFEANLTVFFMAFAAWMFIEALNKDKRILWMSGSMFFFGLNIFSYHSARLVTPLIIFALFLINRSELGVNTFKDVKRALGTYLLPVLILSAFLLTAGIQMFGGGSSRLSDVAIFNPTDKWMAAFDRRYEAVFDGLPSSVARIFSNKATYLFDQFTNAYSTYLSPQFLFTLGPSEWTYGMIAGRGVLHLFEILFVMASVWFIAKKGLGSNKYLSFIVFWILISIIPAALTKGPGYAGNRAAVMMPAIQIFSAFGGIVILDLLRKRSLRRQLFWPAVLGVLLLSTIFFLEDYVYHAPRRGAGGMLYGRKEAVEFLKEVEGDYDEIIVSRSLSEPQIYVGFYQKWDPTDYQNESVDWLRYEEEKRSFVDQLGEYRLGKYTFKDINFNKDIRPPKTLFVGKPQEFSQEIELLKLIKYPDESPAIYIFDPKEDSS